VFGMSAQPAGPAANGPHEMIHLGGETAVVLPLAEYRRLRALEQLASPHEREGAEAAAALEEYREWSAARGHLPRAGPPAAARPGRVRVEWSPRAITTASRFLADTSGMTAVMTALDALA
jgi:hypothetical protein